MTNEKASTAHQYSDVAWRGFALRLLARLVVLGLMATLLSAGLYWSSDVGPIGAFRESLADSHQYSRAYGAPSDLPFKTYLIAFDDKYCLQASGNLGNSEDCQPLDTIARSDIADVVSTASLVGASAILLDFWPNARATCDDETLALARIILDVAHETPVILARGLIGQRVTRSAGTTFFDQCIDSLDTPEIEFLKSGRGVFFAHLMISRITLSRGIDSMRPWVTGIVPEYLIKDGIIDDSSSVYRRIPAASLVAAIAMRTDGSVQLYETLQASGLETRWRPEGEFLNSPQNLSYCLDGESCQLPVGGLDSLPNPKPFQYQFGIQTQRVISRTDVQRIESVEQVSAADFNAETARSLAKRQVSPPSLIVVGATSAGYGDLHTTPIGPLPGAIIHSNAVLGFATNSFLVNPDRWQSFFADIKRLVIFMFCFAAALIIVVIISVWIQISRNHSSDIERVLEHSWPFVLLPAAIVELSLTWNAVHSDYSDGIVSYALIFCVIASYEALLSFKEGLQWGVNKVIESISSAVGEK